MNILVMAAGALGGYVGSAISKQHNVMFIARNTHLQKIQENGLIVKSITSGDHICDAIAYERPPDNYKADMIIYCVKSYHNLKAIPIIKDSVTDSTTILTLQNGIGSGEFLASHFGNNKVILGAAYIDVNLLEYGVIKEHGGDCKIVFGAYGKNNEYHTKKVESILSQTEIKHHLSEKITIDIWEKLIFIAGLSGMTCITNSSFEEVLNYPKTKKLTELLISEVYEVAMASGIPLKKDTVARTMKYFMNFKSELTSSMHQDLLNGNPLEVDSINGAVGKLGKTHKVPTPINDTISSSLSLISNTRQIKFEKLNKEM
jgi:2-dehydropantoate 2-reductase